MLNNTRNAGGTTPINIPNMKTKTLQSTSSLDAIRDMYTNDFSSGGDDADITFSTTKSNTGAGNKLDLFVNQESAVMDRLKKSIRVFVSQEVHGYMQQYKEKIQYLKDTFRTQTALYEEKIDILEEENTTLVQTNNTLKNEVVMWQKKLQEQTDAYTKERQWLLEQLAAYAYTLQYVQNQQPTTKTSDNAPCITVQAPTDNVPRTTSPKRNSNALTTSTSTSDLTTFSSPRSTSSPASHSVGVQQPPPPPAKLPPPPPKLPPKDLYVIKPLKIASKSTPSTPTGTPPKGPGFGNDLIDQIKRVRVDSGSRAAAFAAFEEKRKTTVETTSPGKIATHQLNSSLRQLKKTGGVSKLEEERKRQEEIVRQKVFANKSSSRPTLHTVATSTGALRATPVNNPDSDDDDLESPINMMVNTFMKRKEEESDDEDDGQGLGDMLRSLISSGRNTPVAFARGPP